MTTKTGRPKRTAGAFDVRNIIGALLGIYGVILTIVGLVHNPASDAAKTGDVNVNLWSGIVMLIVAAIFLTWSKLRPIVVPSAAPDSSTETEQ